MVYLRILSVILCLLISTSYFILFTETGLKTTIGFTEMVIPGHLSIGPVTGRLIDSFETHSVYYRNRDMTLEINHLFIAWDPKKLLHGKIFFHEIEAQSLYFRQHTKKQTAKKSLPLSVEVKQGIVHQTDIRISPIDSTIESQKITFHLVTAPKMILTSSVERLRLAHSENTVNFDGDISKTAQGVKFKLHNITGEMQGQEISGHMDVSYNKKQLIIDQSYFKAANLNINIAGTLGETANLHWQADLDNINNLLPTTSGSLKSTGNIDGSFDNPNIHANIILKDFQHNNQSFDKIHLAMDGNLQQQKIQGDIQSSELTANVILVGQYQNNTWQGIIKKMTLTEQHLKTVTLTTPANIIVKKNQATLTDFCLNSLHGDICSTLSWNTKKGFTSQIQGNIDSQSTLLASLNFPTLGISHQPIQQQPVNLSLEVHTENLGSFLQNIPEISHSKGKLHIKATLKGSIEKPQLNSQVTLQDSSLTIPRLGINITNIHGQVKSHNPTQLSYQFSSQLNKEILYISGTTELDKGYPSIITLQGKNLLISNTSEAKIFASPDIKMTIDHKDIQLAGKIEIPKANITPKDLSSTVGLTDDVIFVQNEKPVSQSSWSIHSTLELALGDQVKFDFMGLTSSIGGHLRIQDKPGAGATGIGQLVIQEGQYNAYGQNLTIEEGRLLFTGGPITNPGLNIKATKQISTITPTSNTKGGNLPAVTSIQNTVGISISGTLKQPVVHFFSVPQGLSQSEILSLLVLGRSLNQTSSTDAGLLIKALGALNIGGSQENIIKDQVKNNFGLDELSINATENYDPDKAKVVENTSLVIGKRLSPKLFLNYSIGLLDPINVLRLNYQINQRVRIESETDVNSSGIDLFYSFSKD